MAASQEAFGKTRYHTPGTDIQSSLIPNPARFQYQQTRLFSEGCRRDLSNDTLFDIDTSFEHRSRGVYYLVTHTVSVFLWVFMFPMLVALFVRRPSWREKRRTSALTSTISTLQT